MNASQYVVLTPGFLFVVVLILLFVWLVRRF